MSAELIDDKVEQIRRYFLNRSGTLAGFDFLINDVSKGMVRPYFGIVAVLSGTLFNQTSIKQPGIVMNVTCHAVGTRPSSLFIRERIQERIEELLEKYFNFAGPTQIDFVLV